MTHVLSFNPARSDQSKAAVARAVAQGDRAYARHLDHSCCARLISAEEFHAQPISNALQKAGGVVVIGDSDHAAATTALDKHELVRRVFRRVFFKFKAVIPTLWTR